MPENILFSFKKVKKHTILAGQGGGKCPLLPSPADAHAWTPRSLNKFHGLLKCFYILQMGPLIPVKVVYTIWVQYFTFLILMDDPLDPSPRTPD